MNLAHFFFLLGLFFASFGFVLMEIIVPPTRVKTLSNLACWMMVASYACLSFIWIGLLCKLVASIIN